MAIHVLVVDDEEDFLRALVMRLELRGMEARGVASGYDALEALTERRFDVVVLDIKMPGMDGMEVLRVIRQDHPDVKVLVVTGHASQELSREGLSLGATDYLIKPVNVETVVTRIKAAVGQDDSESED